MRVQSAAAFLEAFCGRVRAARVARGMTQAQMAIALGIGQEAYRSYEKRVLLPHYLIPRFAAITGTEIEYLFSGQKHRAGRQPRRP